MSERMTMSCGDRIDASGSFPASVYTKNNIRQITGEGDDNPSLVEPGSGHPVTSPSPFLPAEILALILQSRSKRCEDRKAWRKIVNVLLSCSLVSRAWYEAARAVLYQDIRLFRVNSVRLLLCTVRERFGGHCPTHTLQFMHPEPHQCNKKQPEEHATLAGEIVACCPETQVPCRRVWLPVLHQQHVPPRVPVFEGAQSIWAEPPHPCPSSIAFMQSRVL
ncbi:hypothetical protein DFJ58DRAFT_447313 [Suillus subalutaceus]|uniref:uncharacterized protein n=1 Tax=Suillus subalutaceus TaxID=48586 RepID=UPI001B86ACCA|nr:uncharacterized protein DFJ58DRAFT_447313 [Suillus subalutaceus]KAG1849929.1 hypothetical protein DFJ58DRAFT_447313 [Suillus subalutaceus]